MALRTSQPHVASITSLKRASSPAAATPLRQSKRVKSSSNTPATSKTTPKKSQYFEQHSESSEPETDIENENSGYEDEDLSASAVSSPPESENQDEEETDDNSEGDGLRKRTAGIKGKNGKGASKVTKGQELWRPGVKTGLGPGQQVFIKLPKAREPGKIPYKDDTIHPNTMLFLSDLKENNDREWLKVHDADYRQSKMDFDSFVESLTEKIVEKDETIPELPPKDLTFRIYRDIRFSPDPTPYKTYFSAAWSRTGRKGPYAGYYVQIQPGGSFVGGGLWHPEAQPLGLMRRDIDRNSHRLKAILTEPSIRKEFFNGISNSEMKAVKAFVGQNTENMLKTKPKGFTAENPNIDLLRLRSYTIGRKLKDEEVVGPKGLGRIVELLGIMTPFITYLNSVVMPDAESSDDDDDDNDDEDDAEENVEEGDDHELPTTD
ncbi:hypothetical protein MMC24_003921 [Lignoscripta atroalba]|nr:hypothetical protein [Lignoscripta atroalba]